ncbi:MAG: hypothetical protein R3349_10430, partial [Geminicoccaceae bacterium]|nr:hypothetical protein [Geminicoccaceae bacterium]
ETGMRVNLFFIAVMQARGMPEAMVGVRRPAKKVGCARTPRITWTMARMLRKRFKNLNRTRLARTGFAMPRL